MNYDDTLVGGLAIMIAMTATAIAVGPWQRPYELRSILSIRKRFGMTAARLAWLIMALACLACGTAILSGVRPSYAAPAGSTSASR